MSTGLRILLAGGGTGGHLYPGLVLADWLKSAAPECEIAFFVTQRDIDRQVLDGGPYAAQYEKAMGFSKKPWRWPALGLSMLVNQRRAGQYLETFRPAAVVGLGGFGSYAAVRQAQKAGLPTFLLNPDLMVGRANRRLARRATAVFCQFGETVEQVRSLGRVEVVGCPVRRQLFGVNRAEACAALGLDAAKRTLVVTGGSLGARSVNEAMILLAPRMRQFETWQVLHIAGKSQYDDVRRGVPAEQRSYVVKDYVSEMGQAYAAADVMVCRAGASTIAELTALGVPSVLVPYPFHRDRHQERHAKVLERGGAAVMVADQLRADMNRDALWKVLPQLIEDRDRRETMAEAARALGHPNAGKSIAASILGVVR